MYTHNAMKKCRSTQFIRDKILPTEWKSHYFNFSSCVQLVVPLNCLLAGEIAPQGTHTTSTPLLLILLLVGHSPFKSQVLNICNFPKISFRVLGSVIRPILAEACKSQELRHGRRVLWKFSFISDNLDLGGGWVGLLVSGGSPDSWIRGSRANNSHQNIILKYIFLECWWFLIIWQFLDLLWT